MAVIIQILFDNRAAVFFPGQQITGNVRVILNSAKLTKGIVVTFIGKAKVSWRQKRKDKIVNYRAEEKYYEMEFYAWGNGNKQTLTEGEYIFPFKFFLPITVPGSFESQTGRVKHECTAKILLVKEFNVKKTLLFSVNPVYDLNTDPLSAESINANKGKMICCCCCKSGPIDITVNIGQSGFVCGEAIIVFAECSNGSNREITYTSASVYMTVTYMAQGSHRSKNKLVCEMRRPAIAPRETDMWSGERLLIPSVPPSYLPDCSIINIEYEFRFIACPSRGINLTIKRPILIGTIPLRQNFNRIAALPSEIHVFPTAPELDIQPVPTEGIYSSNPPSYLSLYPDCPPPSYAECKSFGDASSICSDSNDDEEEPLRVEPFKPRYVSYGFL